MILSLEGGTSHWNQNDTEQNCFFPLFFFKTCRTDKAGHNGVNLPNFSCNVIMGCFWPFLKVSEYFFADAAKMDFEYMENPKHSEIRPSSDFKLCLKNNFLNRPTNCYLRGSEDNVCYILYCHLYMSPSKFFLEDQPDDFKIRWLLVDIVMFFPLYPQAARK